jgi:nucleoside 2-deoxyribosyltransferase
MTITICGSIKFFDQMLGIQDQLERMGHAIFMPIKAEGVDYWSEDNTGRVHAKKQLGLIAEHMDKIEKSDAILVVNLTKGEIQNYIGANTFLEIGFAHYRGKKIYLFNAIPDQGYIKDEMLTVEPIVLDGDLARIA